MAYIDAAFATHEDSKSHSGVAVFITGVLVYSVLKKQACVTKSPTESELVALSDYVGFIISGVCHIYSFRKCCLYRLFIRIVHL
jgi:hypothetical protein